MSPLDSPSPGRGVDRGRPEIAPQMSRAQGRASVAGASGWKAWAALGSDGEMGVLKQFSYSLALRPCK